MSYIINLLEALIVSYGLVELCNINKKNAFFQWHELKKDFIS